MKKKLDRGKLIQAIMKKDKQGINKALQVMKPVKFYTFWPENGKLLLLGDGQEREITEEEKESIINNCDGNYNIINFLDEE